MGRSLLGLKEEFTNVGLDAMPREREGGCIGEHEQEGGHWSQGGHRRGGVDAGTGVVHGGGRALGTRALAGCCEALDAAQ